MDTLMGPLSHPSHPNGALSHPNALFFPTVRDVLLKTPMTTTKTCTDARRTVKKTQIGVTQARATDSRRTKRKSSFELNFAHVFDPPGLDTDAPSRQNGCKIRWTRGSALKGVVSSSRSGQLFSYEPIGGKSHAADSIFVVPRREI